jgi:signal transduction histidine kinase
MKTGIQYAFLLTILIVASSVSHAQHPGVWRYFPEITLPFVLNFTPEGYVLAHNHETVFIYDGYEIKKIHVDSRLGAIQQDEQGRIWSVYNDKSRTMPKVFYGMIMYDPTTEHWQRFPIADLHGKKIGDSDCFEFYEPNHLIMTNHEKFFLYDLETEKSQDILRIEDTSHKEFLSLNRGSAEGVFWGMGDKGIIRFTCDKKGEWLWQDYLIPDAEHRTLQWYPAVLSDQEIYALITEQNNESMSYALMRFHDERWEKLSPNYPSRRYYGWADSLGRIWSTGWLDGSIYMQEPGQEVRKIEGNDILGLPLCEYAIQGEDIAWIGSIGGLMRHAPPLWQPPAKLNPQFHGYEKVLGLDGNGYLWLAKQGQIIRGKGNDIHVYNIELFDYPEDFYEMNFELHLHPLSDGRDALYFFDNMHDSSSNHLVVYDPSKDIIESVTHPNKILINGFPGPENTIYFVCQDPQTEFHSLEQFDGITYKTIFDETTIPEFDKYTRIFHTRSGDIWLLNLYWGPYGIYRKGEYQKIELPKETDLYQPGSAFLELSDGTIWAAFGYSVFEYDNGTWLKKLDCSNDIGVFQMRESQDGDIWVISRKRIYRLKDKIWTYHNYKEGLPSSAFHSIYEDHQHRIWAITRNGDWLFCPEADVDPPVVDIPKDENNRKFLSHVNVRITFIAEDRWKYTDPEKLQYSFCLDKKDWSPFSHDAFAAFPNLEPGSHRLEVTALDVNYNQAITPAVWEFEVLAPWYNETAFIILMMLASIIIIVLLTLLGSRYCNLTRLVSERTDHLAKANEQLLSHRGKLQALTSELFLIEERERRKLASDLHDSISQSLSLSMLELSSLAKVKAVEEIKDQASRIRKRLDQTLQSTRNMTYQLCPPLLYQAGLGAAITQLGEEFQGHHGFVVDFNESGEPDSLAEEHRYFLFRATRELLVNITKHAQASHVDISLTWETNAIRIKVSDDGIGFNRQTTRNHSSDQGGYGLFGLSERATRMGGELHIQSIPKHGTVVNLTIPLQ